MGHWGSLAGSNSLLCQHRTSGLVSKGWAPRTKGSHLIYPCKQVTEPKSKAQPTYGCMWLHWLFHFPSAMWPSSCFISLSFISLLCHPFSLSHYQNTACFSSGPPPWNINLRIYYFLVWECTLFNFCYFQWVNVCVFLPIMWFLLVNVLCELMKKIYSLIIACVLIH
jgi:hypothetical protein